MLSAKEAHNQTSMVISENEKQLREKLTTAVQSAIKQGSMITQFYPRSQVEAVLAMRILKEHEYDTELVHAKDQRDNDYIKISWGAAK